MVKKMKRRTLTDVFIMSWFKTFGRLKIVCKKNFKFESLDSPDFIKGHAYILATPRYQEDPTEFYVIDSNKDLHWVYEYGKKNKFFHKYFEIARLPKK